MRRSSPMSWSSALGLSLVLPVGCGQCQDPGSFSRTYSLITPVQELVEFGDVYLSTDKTRQVAVRSEGNGVVHIIRVRVAGNAAFEVRGTTDLVLQPGVEHSWNVVFTPVEVADADATVIIENNSENRPELRIQLHARGVGFPSCDDGNPCTRDHFDPLLLDCLHVPSADACDDRNACTTADTCVAGRCLGAAVTCLDTDPCTRDLCEATSGCVFINDIGACNDNEPCTAETCDPATGCGHVSLPDGVPCAVGNNSCLIGMQCLGGRCTGTPLPDGAPCTDFLACTIDDRCNSGVCVGTLPDDVQIGAAAHSFGTWDMADVAAVGTKLITVERSRQFAQHGGHIALTVMDTTQRPVKADQVFSQQDEGVLGISAAGQDVALLTYAEPDPVTSYTLRLFRFAADGVLVPAQSAYFMVPDPTSRPHPGKRIAILADHVWECAGFTLRRWHIPELLVSDTGIPCAEVAADHATQKLWIITPLGPLPVQLQRLDPMVMPPTIETRQTVQQSASGLTVLEGLGVFLTVGTAADLWSLNGVDSLGNFPGTTSAASVEPGWALVFRFTSTLSMKVSPAGVDINVLAAVGQTSHAACALGTCLVAGSFPARLESPAHETGLTPVATLGMGGFNRVIDLAGDVVAVSPFGAHKLELLGSNLEVTQSLRFSRTATMVSWQLDGQAPVLGDLFRPTPQASPLGAAYREHGSWLDGRLDQDGSLLGTVTAASALAAQATHGKYVYGADVTGPNQDTGEWALHLKTFDTSQWVPGAPSAIGAVNVIETVFEEADRLKGQRMVRVSPDGQHVVVVQGFVNGLHDNVVRFFGFTVDGTNIVSEWSAGLATPGHYTYDAAYAYPDVLLLTGPADTFGFGNTLEHLRYQGSTGNIEFKGSVPAPQDHFHALLFYDGQIAMLGVEDGIRFYAVGEAEPTGAGELTTLEPPTDLQVIGQRLWVTGRHSVQMFYPPCPPDIPPP